MIVWFAGTVGNRIEVENFCKYRLHSYHSIQDGAATRNVMQNEERTYTLFLDSGAFSAWNLGKPIQVQDYIDYVKNNLSKIDYYVVLDVITQVQASWENQCAMEAQGLKPLPVYHTEDPFPYLDRCLHYDYFCLGGMAKGFTTKQRRDFLDACWERMTDADGAPLTKVHGLGMTSIDLMMRYPWYSVDSTSWLLASAMGNILLPRLTESGPVFDQKPLVLSSSSRSPQQGDDTKHILAMKGKERDRVFGYLAELGVPLGVSEFVKYEGQEILEGQKKCKDGKGQEILETIKEEGVANSRYSRFIVNATFFKRLAAGLGNWRERRFEQKRKAKKGFFSKNVFVQPPVKRAKGKVDHDKNK